MAQEGTEMVSIHKNEPDCPSDLSDGSQVIDEKNDTENEGSHNDSYYDSRDTGSESGREEEAQETGKPVDDDEDRSNPQYIPKRGTFYEHDDRTVASGEETTTTAAETASEKKESSEPQPEKRRPPRKSETINRWTHDKYIENEQTPKSSDELVSTYGYDIRREDAPPHARRTKRYGRGPTKYTRTWEDGDAYRRQSTAPAAPRKPPNPEDFPELDAGNRNRRVRIPRARSRSQPNSNGSSENGFKLRRHASTKAPKHNRPQKISVNNRVTLSSPKTVNEVQSVKEKLPAIENLTISTSATNGQGIRRVNISQPKSVSMDLAKKKVPLPTKPEQNHQTTSKPSLTTESVVAPKQQVSQQQQQTAGAAESRAGAKRYSSLRQRPLSDIYTPQQQMSLQQLSQQQLSQQQSLSQQPLSAQQLSQQPLSAQQLSQQQLSAQQLPQQQLPQQQLSQQQLPQQQLSQQQLAAQQKLVPQQLQQPKTTSIQQSPLFAVTEYQPTNQPASQHQGTTVPQLHQQMLQVHRNTPVASTALGPSTQHQSIQQNQHPQQVRIGMLEPQQQMVSHPHHSLHNLPQAHTIGQMQPSQGYAPPAMMPAQYMQAGNSAVYGGVYGQPPPAPYPHQLYQHHNFAGGVTYYSPTEQEVAPRAPRRPTAAIPIVRPAAPERSGNATERENIDRIVENMFVRKPRIPQQSDPTKAEKLIPQEQSQPSAAESTRISEEKEECAEESRTEEKIAEVQEQKTEECAQDPSIVLDTEQTNIQTDA